MNTEPQPYYACELPVGNRKVIIFYINYNAVATDEVARKSLTFFKSFYPKHEVVLVALDIVRTPVFVGPKDLVALFQGKGIEDFRWEPRNLG